MKTDAVSVLEPTLGVMFPLPSKQYDTLITYSDK